MKKLITVTLTILFLINVVYAQDNLTVANCSEQLEIVLDEYNYLLADFKNGTNCGRLNDLLKDGNAKLSENLEICSEELGWYKIYKLGFFLMTIVAIFSVLYLLYLITINKEEK